MSEIFLTADRLSKIYALTNKKPHEALRDVSLTIYKAEVLSLLGINGAGKTTLISILATLHPPTSGTIYWKGTSVYQNLLAYRAVIGYCPQYSTMEPSLSMEENLIFSGRYYGMSKKAALERKQHLLDRFQLTRYAHSYLHQLSGGYRQRFLLARALMHHPQFVILDEPTVGLDSHVRRDLWKMIRSLQEDNISIVLTTHYLDEAEYLSNRICLIHDGVIRSIDTPQKLKEKHKKCSLEEVFLTFVDDPHSVLFSQDDVIEEESP